MNEKEQRMDMINRIRDACVGDYQLLVRKLYLSGPSLDREWNEGYSAFVTGREVICKYYQHKNNFRPDPPYKHILELEVRPTKRKGEFGFDYADYNLYLWESEAPHRESKVILESYCF